MNAAKYAAVPLVFLFILACVSASAQSGFIRTYGVPPGTGTSSADATPDGGMVYCGGFGSSGFLMRMDASGNTVWARTYSAVGTFDSGTFGTDWQINFRGVAALDNGTFMVVGLGYSPESVLGTHQFSLLCDAAGNPVWSSSQGSIYTDWFSIVEEESSGSVLIAGQATSLSGPMACVKRCNPVTGEFSEVRNVYVGHSDAVALDHGGDGGAVLTGAISFGSYGSFISKMDAALNQVWGHSWSNFFIRSVVGLADGSVVAAGDSMVARFQPSGAVDWSKQLIVGNGTITSLQVRSDGYILLAGWSEPADPYSWLMLLDPSGSEVWSRRYGNPGDQFKVTGLDQLSSGGLRLSGRAGTDVLLIATDDMGLAGSCTYASLVHTLAPMTLLAFDDPINETEPPPVVSPVVCTGAATYIQNTIACTGSLPWVASGQVYNDLNSNGVRDPGEPSFPYSGLSVLPNAGYMFTSAQGEYEFSPADAGTYTINSVPLGPWWQYTQGSAGYSVAFTGADTVFTDLDFGFTPVIDTTNLLATIYAATGPCGTAVNQTFNLFNAGTSTPQGVVGLTLDPLFTFAGADQAPDSIVGDTYYWSFDSLGWFQSIYRTIHIVLPDESHVGESTLTSLNVWADDGNGVLSLVQTEEWSWDVSCSFDPNDKQVSPTGTGPEGVIPADTKWLTYTIRFQNTGTDTAYTVVVEDALSPYLNPASMQVLGSSHALTGVSIGNGGLASFRFDDILLPDSTVNAMGSQGYVIFRLKPLPVTSQLTVITNNAGIYFDLNPPVITNTVHNTLVDCALAEWAVNIIDQEGMLWSGTFNMDTTIYAYQWWLNGVPLFDATEPSVVALESGDYTVALTDPYGCIVMSDPISVIVTSLVEVEQPMFGVLPNPSKYAFVLSSSQRLEPEDRVFIIDVSGRVVRTMGGTGSTWLTIPRERLTSGIYVVRVFRADMPIGAVRVVLE